MLVKDRMSMPAMTIHGDTDCRTALRVMQEYSVRHLPVVDERGTLVGIVAERDVLIAAMRYPDAPANVSKIMRYDVVSVTPDMPITHAAMLMLNHKIGGLPVVGPRHAVVGVITETDIFRAFVEMVPQEKIVDAAPRQRKVSAARTTRPKGGRPKTFRRTRRTV